MRSALWAAPLAFLYGIAIDLRHKLFETKILRSEEFDIPIVCVGNLTVGGTGKTPVTEYLIELLSTRYSVAVLSRGYKRKTSGFVLATTHSPYREIGDEPKQIKLKYPEIPVAVCEKRAEGVHQLRRKHPEVNLIILDDAFQHRYVEPWVNIVLMDYNRPIYTDKLLPWGNLRDRVSQLSRAQLIITTKCPRHLRPLDMRLIRNSIQPQPYQGLFFTRMQQITPQPLFPDLASVPLVPKANIIALAGVASPKSFLDSLKLHFTLRDKLILPDHHSYKVHDMETLLHKLKKLPEDTLILTTEKDAVKLTNRKKIPTQILERLYYIPIRIAFEGESETNFTRRLFQYVRSNHKYSLLHPE